MNDFEVFFYSRKERDITKWSNYFEIYERYFSRFKGKNIRMLEIGVFHGGSLKMWQSYFGTDSEIVGIDIEPGCRKYASGNLKIEIGNQEDPGFLRQIGEKYSPFDIILDDGGHTMNQQITSFRHLFAHVADGGVYMVEDCCTSYWPGHGGGFKNPYSFMEFAKKLADAVNTPFIWEKKDPYLTCLFPLLKGIYFHTGIVVFEKGENLSPISKYSGPEDDSWKGMQEYIQDVHAFLKHVSCCRLLIWLLKELFYTLSGRRRLALLYKNQIKYVIRHWKCGGGHD